MGTCHPAAFPLHVLLFYFYFFKNETSRALTSVASILATLLNFIITHSFLVATLLHDIFFFMRWQGHLTNYQNAHVIIGHSEEIGTSNMSHGCIFHSIERFQ